jgi:vancomycin resistance protein YoaR
MAKKTKDEEKKISALTRFMRNRWVLISVGTAAFIMVILATYAFVYRNTFLPRTTISGVAIGGMTYDQATAAVNQRSQDRLTMTRTFQAQSDAQWQRTLGELGVTTSSTESLNQLWQKQKPKEFAKAIQELLLAPLRPRTATVMVSDLGPEGDEYLQKEIKPVLETPTQETALVIAANTDGGVRIVPGVAGTRIARTQLLEAIRSSFASDQQKITLSVEQFAPQVTPAQAVAAQEKAQRIIQGDWTVVISGASNQTITITELISWLSTTPEIGPDGSAMGLQLTVNQDALRKKVESWGPLVNRQPVNGRLRVDATGVVSLAEDGKPGQVLDRDATVQAISSAVLGAATAERTVQVAMVRSEAAVRADTWQSLGLQKRIGLASTDFSGSPSNRVFNITLGQQRLDRQLVQPGQILSVTDTIGTIEESTGFQLGLVIKGNRTVTEAGGGLCQVSTTLFRSVLNAGLEITQRNNHAYRVSYYERGVGPGLDATIYAPYVDFKWKNDMATPVYMQSSTVGSVITYELFGTPDGRVSEIGKPQIISETAPPEPILIETDTLFTDERKQVETAKSGMVTAVSYTVRKDGKTIHSLAFRSNYQAWAEQWMIGTKPRPTEAASVVQNPL